MNKFVVFLAIMMVMTVMFTMAAVPVFADGAETAEIVEHDHDGDGVADHAADAHTDGTTAVVEHDHDGDGVADHAADAHTVNDGWASLNTSDYIALVVAAVVLVAFVVAIVLFVPKKTKQR